jgi:hypothetical protein
MIKQAPSPFATFLASLGAEGLEVTKPIPVTVRPDGDEFIASFFDANISTGGESPQAAISDLQGLIADLFELLEKEPDEKLGPAMRKQRAVLEEFVCRTSRKTNRPGENARPVFCCS